jgi:signal transduction histidine kinase
LAFAGGDGVPPWVSPAARSEVVIPLIYRNRRIGVLDLYSGYTDAFDETDLEILETLARQLALLIVQERWEVPEDGASGGPADQRPAIRNRGGRNHVAEGANDSQQLQAAYDRLQEFAELKDQILQNISHELRTPLTLIKGYLELMMEGQMGELLPEQRQSLEMIVRKADDVTRIVEEIVSLSPLNRLSMNYQRIPVSELVAELALVFVQRTQGSGIIWDFDPIDDDLYLSGDLAQIRQVFYNILDNSVKFSPEGGRIGVRAVPEQAHVHLIFQDEGIGIPKPRLTQIFETFYQIDGSSTRRFGGLGLGLAVVARVVKAHNGKVWAESELGKGSTFHVLLPKYISPNQVFHPALSSSR